MLRSNHKDQYSNHNYYIDRQWFYFNRRLETIIDKNLIFLGDSIINMWNVESIFKGINFGISGESIQGCLKHLDVIEKIKRQNIVIHIGINDIATETPNNINHKLKILIDKIVQNNIHTYISAILLINESMYENFSGRKKKNSDIREINNYLEKLCNDKNIIFIDGNKYLLKNNELDRNLTIGDGLHLNKQGYAMLQKAFREKIINN